MEKIVILDDFVTRSLLGEKRKIGVGMCYRGDIAALEAAIKR